MQINSLDLRYFSSVCVLTVYNGTVVSQVPGFSEWYNVVYDNEPDTVYTYKLLETK